MQDDINNKTVAISVKATKLTAKALAKIFMAVLRKIQKEHAKNAQKPQGRQSVRRLTGRYDAKAIPIDNEATRIFDRVIKEKKLQVDYAFMPNGPGRYLLLFKATQADAITAAFAEYAKRVMGKARDKRPPIMEQLKKFAELVRAQLPKERERTKEAARDER